MQINYDFLEDYYFERKNFKVKNRVVMAPTTLRASFEDGSVTEDELRYYVLRSKGVGMVITEAAYVNKLARGWEGAISAAEDDKIDSLRRLSSAIQSGGAKSILQLYAAGRETTSEILRGQQPVSASAVPYPKGDHEVPRDLTHQEVADLIDDFARATKRAILAGFDGVEIHGANQYLVQQFFSPDSNQREDVWGGTNDKRARFGLALTAKIAQIIEKYAGKPFLLGYRQSPEESITPGISLEDSLNFAKKLSKLPVDYIHLSLKDAFQSSFRNKQDKTAIIEKYKKVLPENYPIMVAGLLKKPDQVESILDYGATFAALGRQLIIDPNWVQKVIDDDEKSIRYAMAPADFELLCIPKPLKDWLLTRFRNGFPVTTDAEFDDKHPWLYYKHQLISEPKQIDPKKLMTLKRKKDN
ncbi:NADH-dependent flavin oxidoreductase [Leuconostoc palmae]|uniref:NADH-dependent flavin oxidoreductase n=1 Tax=Leuconostoc palmae TaxID=501487 RepID=UPI001C7D4004|nr:NADH-dependent flavin oxidoreductase [Leuconostoc palmae]